MWLALALTLLSFVLFLASLFGVARRGFDAQGRFLAAGKWLILGAALSFVIWLFSLSRLPPPYPVGDVRNYELPQ